MLQVKGQYRPTYVNNLFGILLIKLVAELVGRLVLESSCLGAEMPVSRYTNIIMITIMIMIIIVSILPIQCLPHSRSLTIWASPIV